MREADALLVAGGDARYLAHRLRESGLDEVRPSVDTVWVDLSAGSMALTPRIAADFLAWPEALDDRTAITVVDGRVEVVSDGHWTSFAGPGDDDSVRRPGGAG